MLIRDKQYMQACAKTMLLEYKCFVSDNTWTVISFRSV